MLATKDYFSKWAEAVSLREVKKENIVDLIRNNLICHLCVSKYIILIIGKSFYNSLMDCLCNKFGFKQSNSSTYNGSTNGLGEAFRKALCNLLKKVISTSKRTGMKELEKLVGLQNNTQNAYLSNSIFFSLRHRSSPSVGMPNSF